MADQNVRITDSGSRERVALELMRAIIVQEKTGDNFRKHVLDLYVECLKATAGMRPTT